MTPRILLYNQPHNIEQAGGKAYALWRLKEAGLPVPKWVVVTPESMEGDRLSKDARKELREALEQIGLSGKPLAVRSSSTAEDAAQSSFAGQFESFLGVSQEALEEAIQKVWASGGAERVAAYRASRGEKAGDRPPAALVQEMIAADVAGVAFSVNPVNGDWDESVVSAVPGLGSTLVDGESDADCFVVDRAGVEIRREVATKTLARYLRREGEIGIEERALEGAGSKQPCLSSGDAADVAALARQCEAFFGRPQDVEWAIQGGMLFLLQSRPITTLQNVSFSGGKLFIWDNSNIAESYSGITLPLTFSFARYIYTEVYRQFCLLLKVSPKRVERHRAVFGQMLGLVRGRVYYNLISWYKVLALLPGYELNQGFMEQMMGVKEGLSADAQREVAKVRSGGKVSDAFHLARTVGGLVWAHFTIERDVGRFYRRLERSLGSLAKPIETMRLEELADHFHDLERDLLTSWDAPLINDFLAMIFFGLLKKQCRKRLGAEGEHLSNDLLCGIGGIISAEPAKRMKEMARMAAEDPEIAAALREGSTGEVALALESDPSLRAAISAYLEKFGDRCLDELKLESAALVDDPRPLYRSIGELAASVEPEPEPERVQARRGAVDTRQADAERRLWNVMGGNPFRKAMMCWILKHARRRVASRENLRFERTRLFGRVRRVFLEMGKRLHAFNVIDEPRDVFYLEVYEIVGFIEGSGVTTDLRALIELRKNEYGRFADEEAPDDRFETRGAVPIGNRFKSDRTEEESAANDSDRSRMRGIGCCPGRVRGVARVVRDPHGAMLKKGEILVAKQTDPGWIMLFPLAAGLLVERGSLLSHSAIVSRELGLPAVVSLRGLLERVRSGDEVELDGMTGEVRVWAQGGSETEDAPEIESVVPLENDGYQS